MTEEEARVGAILIPSVFGADLNLTGVPEMRVCLSAHFRNPDLPRWRVEVADDRRLLAEFTDSPGSLRVVDKWPNAMEIVISRAMAKYQEMGFCPQL